MQSTYGLLRRRSGKLESKHEGGRAVCDAFFEGTKQVSRPAAAADSVDRLKL